MNMIPMGNELTPGEFDPVLSEELYRGAPLLKGNTGTIEEISNEPLTWEMDPGDYQVIGVDERRLVRMTTKPPFRYICKLECLFVHPRTKRQRRGGCTGTLIAANKVLTAAHCLYRRGYGFARQIRVIPAKRGSQEPFGHAFASKINVPDRYRNAKGAARRRPYDYGIITINKPLGRKAGWWRSLKAAPRSLLLKNPVHTTGYPGDKGGQQQYYARNKVVKVHRRRIEYLLDTFGGQSGSPIWIRQGSKRVIIGVHTTMDIPGGPVANAGLRLTPAILATIRHWLN